MAHPSILRAFIVKLEKHGMKTVSILLSLSKSRKNELKVKGGSIGT